MQWIVAVLAAVVAGMIGSVAGGLILSVTRNQSAMDTASAFFGMLAAVYVGSRVAPSPVRASKIFASVVGAFAIIALVVIVLNPRAASQEGAIIGQPLGQILGAVVAAMLISAHAGSEPTRVGKGVGGLLGLAGVLLVVGAGLYTAFLTVALYGAIWGPIGVIAVFVLPPMWIAAPFVLWWISGGFPLVYFIAWLATWVGVIISGAGSSLMEKRTGGETPAVS